VSKGPGDTEVIPGNDCPSWHTNDRRRTFSASKKGLFFKLLVKMELISMKRFSSLEREEPLHVSLLILLGRF